MPGRSLKTPLLLSPGPVAHLLLCSGHCCSFLGPLPAPSPVHLIRLHTSIYTWVSALPSWAIPKSTYLPNSQGWYLPRDMRLSSQQVAPCPSEDSGQKPVRAWLHLPHTLLPFRSKSYEHHRHNTLPLPPWSKPPSCAPFIVQLPKWPQPVGSPSLQLFSSSTFLEHARLILPQGLHTCGSSACVFPRSLYLLVDASSLPTLHILFALSLFSPLSPQNIRNEGFLRFCFTAFPNSGA